MLDVQLLQRPPHLRQLRLVDLPARLRRDEVVAAPVGVERREQTMRADRLRQSAKAGGRALLLAQENRSDRAGRVVHRHDQIQIGALAQPCVFEPS